MTQSATAAETGTAQPGEQVITLPDNAKSSIAPDILATLPPEYQQTNSDGEPPEDSIEQDGEVPPVSDEEADGEAPEDDAQVVLASWVGKFDANPRSITEVPRALQPQVVQAHRQWQENVMAAALQEAYIRGFQDREQSSTVERQVQALDELLEQGDVLTYREKVAQFPGGERAYHRVKADMAPVPEASPEFYSRKAQEILSPLEREFPDAAQQLKGQWNYHATESDLERLRNDVAMARAASLLARNREDPNLRKLEERKAAAERRKGLPKPEVSPPGAGTAGATPTLAEVKGWTPQQWMAYEAKHGKMALDKLARSFS